MLVACQLWGQDENSQLLSRMLVASSKCRNWLLLALCATCLQVAPRQVMANDTHSIQFDGETFELSLVQAGPTETINEYRIASDAESWRKMVAVRWYPNLNDHEAAVAQLIKVLKAQNPDARYAAWKLNDGSGTGMDFVTWENDSYVEFDIFIYRSNPSGRGLIADQIALRSYGSDQRAFLDKLPETRGRLLELAVKYSFPTIVTEN